MTVREKLLGPVSRLRGIADAKMGLRRYRIFLRTSTPSDGRGGRGATVANADVELTEKPRVREAGGQDIASSGGRIESGDYIIDRITPLNDAATIGIAPGTISAGRTIEGDKVLVVLVGPGMPAYVASTASGGGEFTVVSSNESGNFGLSYVLRPRTGAR